MGTNGTGRFTDYPGGRPSAGGAGGTSPDEAGGENACARAIGNVPLEDVARCPYYTRTASVPAAGVAIRLRNALYENRLAIETETGEILGLVPTRYNYLLSCMAQGYMYAGHVLSSTQQPIPAVHVDLGPTP